MSSSHLIVQLLYVMGFVVFYFQIIKVPETIGPKASLKMLARSNLFWISIICFAVASCLQEFWRIRP